MLGGRDGKPLSSAVSPAATLAVIPPWPPAGEFALPFPVSPPIREGTAEGGRGRRTCTDFAAGGNNTGVFPAYLFPLPSGTAKRCHAHIYAAA